MELVEFSENVYPDDTAFSYLLQHEQPHLDLQFCHVVSNCQYDSLD